MRRLLETSAETTCSGVGLVHAEQVVTSDAVHVVVHVAHAVSGTVVLDFQPCSIALHGAISQHGSLVGVVGSTLILDVVPRDPSLTAKIVITDVIASGCSALLQQLDGEMPLSVECAAVKSELPWQVAASAGVLASGPGPSMAAATTVHELDKTVSPITGVSIALACVFTFLGAFLCCIIIRSVLCSSRGRLRRRSRFKAQRLPTDDDLDTPLDEPRRSHEPECAMDDEEEIGEDGEEHEETLSEVAEKVGEKVVQRVGKLIDAVSPFGGGRKAPPPCSASSSGCGGHCNRPTMCSASITSKLPARGSEHHQASAHGSLPGSSQQSGTSAAKSGAPTRLGSPPCIPLSKAAIEDQAKMRATGANGSKMTGKKEQQVKEKEGTAVRATKLGDVVMGGAHWERRRARANAAFDALKSMDHVDDLHESILPSDSISNVAPQSVVQVTSCVPVPLSKKGRRPPPRSGQRHATILE